MPSNMFSPRNSSGQWKTFEITPAAGEREWVDYIPVQEVTEVAASADRFEDDGHIPMDSLADVSGLTEWVDYVPVNTVTSRTARWKTDDSNGFIPVVDKTP